MQKPEAAARPGRCMVVPAIYLQPRPRCLAGARVSAADPQAACCPLSHCLVSTHTRVHTAVPRSTCWMCGEPPGAAAAL